MTSPRGSQDTHRTPLVLEWADVRLGWGGVESQVRSAVTLL